MVWVLSTGWQRVVTTPRTTTTGELAFHGVDPSMPPCSAPVEGLLAVPRQTFVLVLEVRPAPQITPDGGVTSEPLPTIVLQVTFP